MSLSPANDENVGITCTAGTDGEDIQHVEIRARWELQQQMGTAEHAAFSFLYWPLNHSRDKSYSSQLLGEIKGKMTKKTGGWWLWSSKAYFRPPFSCFLWQVKLVLLHTKKENNF